MNKITKYMFIYLSLFLLTFITARLTNAFFSDINTSTTNTFQAATIFATSTPTNSPVPTNSPTPTISPTSTPTPTPTIVQHLVISEVLNQPSIDQRNGGQGGENRWEFVEIHNPTNVSVDLSGWNIYDGSDQEALSGTLASGGMLIITGATEPEFESIWTTVPVSVIYVSLDPLDSKIFNGLESSGGTIYLRNGSNTIDSMSWGTNTAGFTSGCNVTCPSPSTGSSLGRSPLNQDSDSATDFVINNPPNPGS